MAETRRQAGEMRSTGLGARQSGAGKLPPARLAPSCAALRDRRNSRKQATMREAALTTNIKKGGFLDIDVVKSNYEVNLRRSRRALIQAQFLD